MAQSNYRRDLEKLDYLKATEAFEKEYEATEIVSAEAVLMKHILDLEERVTELENLTRQP